MTDELQAFESTIKKTHRFGWTPTFQEEIRTKLNQTVFAPIATQTFETLGWEVEFQDDSFVKATRKGDWNIATEEITVTFDYGKVTVKSISLGNGYWDMGKNSKRVKLFIHAFQQIEQGFDRETLLELEKEVESVRNWDDYEIPAKLPPPQKRKAPNIRIPIIGAFVTAVLLGFTIAFISYKVAYIIFLFEIGAAFAIGLAFKYLIKWGNYTNYDMLYKLMIGVIFLTYAFNIYFEYRFICIEFDYDTLGFLEFLRLRLITGLTIKSLNLGWIGLIISWAIQLGLTYLLASVRLFHIYTNYQFERVPIEVIDFAFYHGVKEKTEIEIRNELAKMGWTETQDQNEVFEAIGAIQDSMEVERMG